MFSGYKQRLISGEQEVTFSRRSNGDRAGRQYVSVKPYLPILDGILFGDFCSRPMYQAVANACGDVIGYKAYLASQQQQQQQQAASPTGLAPSLFTRQNYKCKF